MKTEIPYDFMPPEQHFGSPGELLSAVNRYQQTRELLNGEYASTFPHCSMKSSEYLWPKTKRLVKDERRSKSKLRVCA